MNYPASCVFSVVFGKVLSSTGDDTAYFIGFLAGNSRRTGCSGST